MDVIGRWLLQRGKIYSKTALSGIRKVVLIGRWLSHRGLLAPWRIRKVAVVGR